MKVRVHPRILPSLLWAWVGITAFGGLAYAYSPKLPLEDNSPPVAACATCDFQAPIYHTSIEEHYGLATITPTPTATPTPEPTATPNPTSTPSPSPTKTPNLPQPTAVGSNTQPSGQPSGGTQADFIRGWYDGGGAGWSLAIALCMIPLESGWNVYAYNAAGPFYGLMQFLISTWNSVGGGNINSAYQQGVNGARLFHRSNPATQWPVAYARCT